MTARAFELLSNGYVSVRDRASGLTGLWHTDGSPRHGDLTRTTVAYAIGLEVARRYGR